MNIRDITKQRIADTLMKELPIEALPIKSAESLSESICVALEELLKEQEGFVPVPNEPRGGNSITEIPNAPKCTHCEGDGFHSTEPLFGDIPHHDTCHFCGGTGFEEVT